MQTIINSAYWFFVSLMFALFEVENEGKYGWSTRSQTWFVLPKHLPEWMKKFFNKPLTGYHFFMGIPWTLKTEFYALAVYLAWTPLWDLLWLIFNPNYGIEKLGARKLGGIKIVGG